MRRFSLSLTALLFASIASADLFGALALAKKSISSGDDEELNPLIVELRLRNRVLSPAFPAVLVNRKYLCLPFKMLCDTLQIESSVDLKELLAIASLPAPFGKFLLNAKRGQVESGSGMVQIVDLARVRSLDGDLFVDAQLITSWLPVHFQFDYSKLELTALPTAPLPIDAVWEREARRSALNKRQSQAALDPPPGPMPKHSFLSVPFLDLTLSSDYRGAGSHISAPFQRIQISGSGDLFFMNAKWFTAGDWSNPFKLARMTLGQTDSGGRLLGPFRAREFSFGDLWLASSPLLAKSRLGLGFEVSSFPLQRSAEISKTTIAGDAIPGWEIELYRNDELIAYQAAAANGTYRFEDVPLLLGQNDFRVVSYGPKGEVRQESRPVFVGAGMTKPGENNYRVAVARQSDDLFTTENVAETQDRGKTRWLAEFEHGISSVSALSLRVARVPFQTEDRTYEVLGLRQSLGRSFGSLDALFDGTGGWGIAAGFQTRIKNSNLSLELGKFEGGFVSEQVGRVGRPFSLLGKARLDGSYRMGSWMPIAYSFGLEYAQDVDGHPDAVLTGRFATSLAGAVYSNSLQIGRRFEEEENAVGAFSIRKHIGSLWYRGELGYSLESPSLQNVSFSADWLGKRDFRGQLGVRQELFDAGRSLLFASLHRRTDATSMGLNLEYDQQGHFGGGFVLSMGLGADPRSGKLMASGDGFSATGLISLRVFHDKNGNGTFDSGDVPLSGVRFYAGRRRLEGATGEKGTVLLKGLVPDQPVQLEIDPVSLDDPTLSAAVQKLFVTPRSGSAALIELPMICVADVEGLVTILRDGKPLPLAGIEVILADGNGKEVARTTTAYDGDYLFEAVRPGSYFLRLDAEPLDRLGLAAPQPSPISIRADGKVTSRVDFSLLQKLGFVFLGL